MDSLSGIAMFVQVAESRNVTAAARLLGVSPSAVGKSIARMEARLSVKLFDRTRRSVALTAQGTLFLERCRRILGEIDDAEAECAHAACTPRGRLRVSAPQMTGVVMHLVAGFMAACPDVQLDVDFSDRMVDLIGEGYDVVIRTGGQRDARLATRRLGTCEQVLVASRAYLEAHGTPRHPGELAHHACLRHRDAATGMLAPWPMLQAVMVPDNLACTTRESLAAGVLHDRGIAFLPSLMVRAALDDGRVQPVLGDYVRQALTFSMHWPASPYVPAKLRAFVDYVTLHLAVH